MSTTTSKTPNTNTDKSSPKSKQETDKKPQGPQPPSDAFWHKYSPNFEFPLANMGSVLIHVGIVVLLLLFLAGVFSPAAKEPPKWKHPLAVVGGDSNGDDGGTLGSGGGEPLKEKEVFERDPSIPEVPPTPTQLAKVEVVIADVVKTPDAVDAVPLAELPNLKKFAKMEDAIVKSLLEGANGRKGKGNSTGEGTENVEGDGDGPNKGTGKTAARVLRWTLSFRTADGRDYLRQLEVMKARLLIPQPNDWKSLNIVEDLDRANKGKPISLEEVRALNEMPFTDDRPDSVRAIAKALDLDFIPPYFVAVFPREIEQELSEKELARAGLPKEKEHRIESTTFAISVRGGKPAITVVDQRLKR